jgi:ketosteroid isomerase-like protein
MADEDIRLTLERHWAASEAGDYDAEHAIYHEDAVLSYPQSGERIRGREKIKAGRAGHPAKRHFVVDRIVGSGDLWVTEYVITYDGTPTYTVSIMEFRDGKVQRETQYFGDRFEAPAWRAALVERTR